MEKIILVKPNLSYADEIQRYKKEFLEDKPIINGSAGLDRFSTVEDWLEELKKRTFSRFYSQKNSLISILLLFLTSYIINSHS